jgi:acyl carrier protein
VTEQEARDVVRAAIGEIAPDVDPADLSDGARLRQDLELDSLDFLRVLETIVQRTGVDIPEDAYAEVATVKGLVGYLSAHG